MDTELKTKLEDVSKTLHDMRQSQEEGQKKADALFEEKMAKAKAEFAAKEKALEERIDAEKAAREEQAKKLEEFETALSRPGAAGGGDDLKAKYDAEVKTFNDWASGKMSDEAFEAESKTWVTNVGTDGGFLIPTRTRDGIVEQLYRSSPIRQLATIEQGPIYEFLIERGEMGTAATTETGTRSVTADTDLHKVTIDTHERYAMPKVSNRMLRQGTIDVAAHLARKAAQKFARDEASDFVTGDGVSKPMGFLSYSKSTAADDSRALQTLQYRFTGVSGGFAAAPAGADIFVRTYYDMQEEYSMNGTWLMKNTTMAEVALLKDSNGDPILRDRAINEGSFVMSIQGRPARQADHMPAIAADAFGIAFGDFSKYIIVDTPQISTIKDEVTTKPFTLFHMTRLVGGGLEDWDAIKLIKFGMS